MLSTAHAVISAVKPSLKRCLIYGKYTFSTYVYWNEKAQSVQKRSKISLFLVKATLVPLILYIVAQQYLLWNASVHKLERLQAGVFAVMLGAAIQLRFDLNIDIEPYQLINAVILSEPLKRKPAADNSLLPFMLKHFFRAAEVTTWLIILFPTILAIKEPCKLPLVIGRVLLGEQGCNSVGGRSLSIRIIVTAAEFLVYANAAFGGIFYVLFCLFLQVIVLYVEMAQTFSLNITKQGMLQKYRKLQVWERIVNNTIRLRLMGEPMLFLSALHVVLTTSIVLFHEEMGSFMLGLFLLILTEMVPFQFCVLTGAAEIYKLSLKWKREWKGGRAQFWEKGTLFRREVKSIRALKIEFADNFVDSLTPLIVQNFCWNQSISMILLNRIKK